MITETLVAAEKDAGVRLDVFLAGELTDYSRSRVKSAIEKGLVQINGVTAFKAGVSLKIGDAVRVEIEEPLILSAKPEDIPINIVYQDKDLAVINKEQGMVTHPAPGSSDGTLVNAILYHIKDLSTINGVIRPGIVHRLDKDTSGLIVIAKNDAAHNSLAAQIAAKTARRSYIALTDGVFKEDIGKVEQPIGRDKKDRKKMAVAEDGRYALTTYKVLERFKGYTLVEFTLSTGRTHQIRVHTKYIHHPVVGDRLYGNPDKFGLLGQLLHAYKLEFIHPSTGEEMSFTAPLPDYFEKVIEKLRKQL